MEAETGVQKLISQTEEAMKEKISKLDKEYA